MVEDVDDASTYDSQPHQKEYGREDAFQ